MREFQSFLQNAASHSDLLSGIIGVLLGTVIGGAIAYLGSARLQHRADKDKRNGAGRAVLAELVTNAASLAIYRRNVGEHALSDVVWRTQLPLVAQLLPMEHLDTIIVSYWELSRVQALK